MTTERIEVERDGFGCWHWAALDLNDYQERGVAWTRRGAIRQARRAYRQAARRARSREVIELGLRKPPPTEGSP